MRKYVFIIPIVMVLVITTIAGAAPPAQSPEGQSYIVQADDWLSKISDKFLGDVLAFDQIVEATNGKAAEDDSYILISDPDVIEVGQKIWIPVDSVEIVVAPNSIALPGDAFYPESVAVQDGYAYLS
ncbi:MAG: LysM peptidoglycan-binding domain-containing protein, partial [Chloroflexota bacterium]